MAVTNIEGYGTFRKMDKQSVMGFLKATGSRDADILSLHKQKLLAPNKNLRLASYFMIAAGAGMTLMVIFFFIGIPLVLLGLWMWWFSRRNIAVVEAAYTEYLASPA